MLFLKINIIEGEDTEIPEKSSKSTVGEFMNFFENNLQNDKQNEFPDNDNINIVTAIKEFTTVSSEFDEDFKHDSHINFLFYPQNKY